ncbi:patatin-like phospholipase family protein, partial [Flavobacterium sp.]|uniref:patatin-like phospholipase family protein n=1 Tax=Flavobacterium sp. TaxID=239 RepID=UPI0037C0B7EB
MLKDKIKITHLVLSGGGSHGSVQVGALRFLYLENMHHNVTHIACCSIGCFVAVMFIFKFTIEEMEDTIREVIIYKDFTFIPKSRYLKIISDFGLTDTTKVTDMLIKKIRTKYPDYDIENMTFIDIAKRFGINLYISATNLNTKMNKIFCVEDTPNELVFSALHASICIPFLFKPVDIDGEYYIDGG